MNKKVLIIDDDKDLCTIIKKYLEREGYTAKTAHTGSKGTIMAQQESYHLVILDVMLPEIDGFNALSLIRDISNVPVLMLTAKDDDNDKIKGLRRGADDYMTKPFNMNELMARVGSLIRRYTALGEDKTSGNVLQFKSLQMNPANHEVYVGHTAVELTGKEFDLLYFLASHEGTIFTKKQIYNNVWADEYAFDDSNIMAFISKLRRKVEKDPGSPQIIQTVRGVGYRFKDDK